MKKIILFTVLLFSIVSFSQTFTINDINYNVTSASDPFEVEVTGGTATGDVIIPSTVDDNGITYTVTSIAASSFANNTVVTGFVMPNTVTSLGERAFLRSTGITSVTLSSALTEIGRVNFFECTNLVSVYNFPASLVTLGDKVWEGCTSLETFTVLGETPFAVGSRTFFGSTTSATLTVPTAQAKTNYEAADYWSDFNSIEVAASTEADILTFELDEETGSADINPSEKTVDIEVAFGTDVTSLTPTVTTSTGSSITAGITNDFTNPVMYTITAEDGITTQDWTITVTIADEVLSLSEFKELSNSVYPNPATDIVYIDANVQTETYKVMSISGALIKEQKATGSLDISDLAPGLYLLITDDGTARLIKQ